MVKFDLEYGSTEIHIHKDALEHHQNLLIVDDLLATGGTALAAIELINKFENKNILGSGFIINLPELNGEKKLKIVKEQMKHYDFSNDIYETFKKRYINYRDIVMQEVF